MHLFIFTGSWMMPRERTFASEMHKERAHGRGINFQWGDKNGRDAFRVNIRSTQTGNAKCI